MMCGQSLCGYFSGRVVALEPLDSEMQCIIAAHPHGLGTSYLIDNTHI